VGQFLSGFMGQLYPGGDTILEYHVFFLRTRLGDIKYTKNANY
jgi:hypothetical protein